eukprot:990465-Prorocentrum_lima.AAC.1
MASDQAESGWQESPCDDSAYETSRAHRQIWKTTRWWMSLRIKQGTKDKDNQADYTPKDESWYQSLEEGGEWM